MLPIIDVEVKAGILPRNLVSHGMLEGAVVNQRHCWIGVVKGKETSKLLDHNSSNLHQLYRIKEITTCHVFMSTNPHPLRS